MNEDKAPMTRDHVPAGPPVSASLICECHKAPWASKLALAMHLSHCRRKGFPPGVPLLPERRRSAPSAPAEVETAFAEVFGCAKAGKADCQHCLAALQKLRLTVLKLRVWVIREAHRGRKFAEAAATAEDIIRRTKELQ